MSMIDDAIKELSSDIEKAHESLRRELTKLRTGRANAALLDSLKVDYYGVPTPIQQMAAISVPEARMLVVKPWEKTQLKAIEKAIIESNLGLNPQNDGLIIRIPMPALTEERRRDLTKLAKKAGEDCKIVIRKNRHDCKDMLDALKEEGEATEDEVERAKKRLEEVVTEAQSKTDDIVSRKEADIMEI
jgi:ribosome recycling factor